MTDQEMRGATLYAKLMDCLVNHGPASYADLVEYSGLSYHTVMRYCKALAGTKTPLIVISAWEFDSTGRASVPCWQFVKEGVKAMPRPRRTKAQKAALARKARLMKKLQGQTSVFDLYVPRYAEGAR